MASIPKIIHQLWIGPKPAPTKFMATWKDKNPDFEYIFWNENEFIKRGIEFRCQNKIDDISEINGKADIMRWEILHIYGGVFIDADSICIEAIDDILMSCSSFAGWEQETIRKGLIACGTMGFPPQHPLVKAAIDWISQNDVSHHKTQMMAWQTVGPGLLTRMHNLGVAKDMAIFPSYTFLPIHFAGIEYTGHAKVYAFQEWGSTKQNYEIMNTINLPTQFYKPSQSLSVLVSSLNTKAAYVKDCLNSIKDQQGAFNIELVWINDGSDEIHTAILKQLLDHFQKTTRFVTIVYSENDANNGLGFSLNKGVQLCTNEIIMRMDADDIMHPQRLSKQYEFITNTPDCVLCGSQIVMFKVENDNIINRGTTQHPNIDINQFLQDKPHWIMNHPTFCFKKTPIIQLGNYNAQLHSMCEDFELILRVLKKHAKIYNMPEPLLYYRLHEQQLTFNGGKEGSSFWTQKRNNLISDIFN